MIGSWLTSKTCRKSTSDWNADATRIPQRAAASECSEKSVAIKIVRNGTRKSYHLPPACQAPKSNEKDAEEGAGTFHRLAENRRGSRVRADSRGAARRGIRASR